MFTVVALLGSACSSYLDVNTNPNLATSVTPNLVLPQALVTTASLMSSYNTYGSQVVGYSCNAGGYGSFNQLFTYLYTSSDYNGPWNNAYDNLEDYQYIINSTKGQFNNSYYNAAATIMRVHNFQLLVDTYSDVPYSQALLGSGNLAPAYDKGTDIYPALATELDDAIKTINDGLSAQAQPDPINSSDPLFAGNMTSWIQLANTIKLRLMVRGNGKVTFANNNFDPAGFLTDDAMINPGFTRDNSRQNPFWNTWAWGYTGAAANKAWIPTTWIMSFYNGTTLIDSARGLASYYKFRRVQFPNSTGRKVVYGDSINNQLGTINNIAPACPSGSFWYSGTDRGGTTGGNSMGILKGPNAGVPLLTAAESYFLQAEAAMSLTISGYTLASAGTSFNNGILASFKYLYKLPSGVVSSLSHVGSPPTDYATDFASYVANNSGNYLVDFAAAGGDATKQLEAIITQKYIALNYIHGHEAWNEYRRTLYPRISGTLATTTFVSIGSALSTPDRLPKRILYPATESAYNGANIPQGTTVTTPIFWSK